MMSACKNYVVFACMVLCEPGPCVVCNICVEAMTPSSKALSVQTISTTHVLIVSDHGMRGCRGVVL